MLILHLCISEKKKKQLLLFVGVFSCLGRRGAQFPTRPQPARFGWIISPIIPRMQSETPKPQQQQQQQRRASQVIMAIRDTSSSWSLAATKGFPLLLFLLLFLRFMTTHTGSHAARRPAGVLAQIWRKDIASDRHGSVGAVHKGKTSVYMYVCSCLLACRLNNRWGRRFSVMLNTLKYSGCSQ